MIKSILIPTDGSHNSNISLDYGLHFAGLFKAEICGLNVIDVRSLEGPFLSDISGSLGFSPFQNYLPKFQNILQERSTFVLDEFKKRCTPRGIEPKTSQMTGVVPAIIAEEAKKVDFVIIAQRGEHEQWSTGLLGSTTESVVRRSPRPVLVTPNTYRPIRKAIIAYDGGIESNKAMKSACEMAPVLGCTLQVVFVTDSEENSVELTGEVNAFMGPYNLEYSIEWLNSKGHVGREILSYAESHEFDMIVMGAFGHSRIHDLILGGTTCYIMRQSSIPILLNR
jgi:nucleotide-binding universal stress UspA family protein